MIVRTEFSFRQAYGSVEKCFDRLPSGGIIADSGAWGHVPWSKEAKKRGIPRGLGARLRIGDPKNWREMIVVPTTSAGLRDLYSRIRLAQGRVLPPHELGAGDWALIAAPAKVGSPPSLPTGTLVPLVPGHYRGRAVAFSDNFYPAPGDARAWAFALGARAWSSAAPAHILGAAELRAEGASPEALAGTEELLLAANEVVLPTAQNIRFPVEDAQHTLSEMASAELINRGLGTEYVVRLHRELGLIAEKKFADYFLVIAEMIQWAKERMLVGPGRGSSAGSIVCWLLRITEIDPLKHGLLFERFIDTNRADLPDIDIDFPDEGRESVLAHLAEKYGEENVAHIGTVMRYKAKSALTDVAKELDIPPWELDALKDVIVERSSGDSRANDCLRDTLEGMEAGRKLLEKYPDLIVACDLEGGARQSGKHAAGMIVCNESVEHFCAIGANRVAQIDKKMAEALNILKIDALGLRTLSVLATACQIAGIDHNMLYALPLDDAQAIDVFNQNRWSGIFQFEGNAVQSLGNQIRFNRFEDISALTALARPGPLGGGEATRWIQRHEGAEEPVPPHPMLKALTEETYGTVLYQEQIMEMVRTLGKFSWADTSAIRKVMSDRRGDEAFRKYQQQFIKGAMEQGVSAVEADKIWKAINTFGSWSFNKSHAVAYGTVSYWCAYLKAHHPLAFAAGCLRHAKDTDSALLQLRELAREGVSYRALDPDRSMEDWTVQDGTLLGGLTGVPGIGQRKALEIINRRTNGLALTEGLANLLKRESVFANIFPVRSRFKDIYEHPERAKLSNPSALTEIMFINPPAEVYIIGKLLKKNLRDLNEERFLVKRGGVRFTDRTKMLVMHLSDDSGRIIGIIGRDDYERLGAEIVEKGIAGDTYLMVRGWVNEARFLSIKAVRWL